MPKRANDISKAGAIEGVRWYFSDERPPGPPPKPYWLTYTGDDVVSVKGIGLFQNGTTAEVGPVTAARFRDQPGWLVRERERPRDPHDDDHDDDGDEDGGVEAAPAGDAPPREENADADRREDAT